MAKIVYNFGLSECNRVKTTCLNTLNHYSIISSSIMFVSMKGDTCVDPIIKDHFSNSSEISMTTVIKYGKMFPFLLCLPQA